MSKYRYTKAKPVVTLAVKLNSLYADSEEDKMKTVRPPYSYAALISLAIQESPEKRLKGTGIYDYITKHFPYYRNQENQGWRKAVRYNLSVEECFMKLPAPAPSRSHYWALDPNHEVFFKEGSYCRRMPRSWRRPVSTAHPYYPPMPGTMTADYSLMACRPAFNDWQMEMWDTFSTSSALPTQNGNHSNNNASQFPLTAQSSVAYGKPFFMHSPRSSELPHCSTSVSLITPYPPPSTTADTSFDIDFLLSGESS